MPGSSLRVGRRFRGMRRRHSSGETRYSLLKRRDNDAESVPGRVREGSMAAVNRVTIHHQGAGDPNEAFNFLSDAKYSVGIGITTFRVERSPATPSPRRASTGCTVSRSASPATATTTRSRTRTSSSSVRLSPMRSVRLGDRRTRGVLHDDTGNPVKLGRVDRGRGELIDHIFVRRARPAEGTHREQRNEPRRATELASVDDDPTALRNHPGSDHAPITAVLNI